MTPMNTKVLALLIAFLVSLLCLLYVMFPPQLPPVALIAIATLMVPVLLAMTSLPYGGKVQTLLCTGTINTVTIAHILGSFPDLQGYTRWPQFINYHPQESPSPFPTPGLDMNCLPSEQYLHLLHHCPLPFSMNSHALVHIATSILTDGLLEAHITI